jgi:SAM-dependent methyltransferase
VADPHRDPWRVVDASPTPATLAAALEVRGRTPGQVRLRRRFLRWVPVRAAQRVLEVGCGTGVVARDLAAIVGRRGVVAAIDPSAALLARARSLSRGAAGGRLVFRRASGDALPFADARFDTTLAITVLLHVANPQTVVKEMARVTRPGGRVAVQDQDFGLIGVAHPDRALTAKILEGVAAKIYEEPHSGRRLGALLRAAGLADVRVLTDVYQDTGLNPFSRSFLERRAENAVRFGLVDAPTAQDWLDGFNALHAEGNFLLTMQYFGAAGVRPDGARR